MGSLNFLVSDEKRDYFDLAKLYLTEDAVEDLRQTPPEDLRLNVAAWLSDHADDVNGPMDQPEIDAVSERAAAWMLAHPDWRFLNENDDEFDDVVLAEDEADAAEYLS